MSGLQAGMVTRWPLPNLVAAIDRLEQSFTARFDSMNQRLDRIVLTLAAGLMAIIAALVTQNLI
jgi:hypothetical protein